MADHTGQTYAEFYWPDGRLAHHEWAMIWTKEDLHTRTPWGGSFRVSSTEVMKARAAAIPQELVGAAFLRDM